ncbi:hypothetical protein TNCV_4080051, partial [Trichonephila clavipes]
MQVEQIGDRSSYGLKRWANRRCLSKMGRKRHSVQRHDGSHRPRASADRENRLIVISAIKASNSSLSIIRRTTRTRVSTMTIRRR